MNQLIKRQQSLFVKTFKLNRLIEQELQGSYKDDEQKNKMINLGFTAEESMLGKYELLKDLYQNLKLRLYESREN